MAKNSFGAAAKLRASGAEYEYFRLATLEERGMASVSRLPFSTKILLENLLRFEDGQRVTAADIEYVARGESSPNGKEISFMPARVLLQDFTGVPCVVDLAAMRDALAAMGADPQRANPLMPADLVIDHSVQVDQFGIEGCLRRSTRCSNSSATASATCCCAGAQTAFQNFRVVPPDTGIVHQVNLEYLASVVFRAERTARIRIRWSAPIRTPP